MQCSDDCPDCSAKNKGICPCDEDCKNHGRCCDCIKFHIGNKKWPKTACMTEGKLKK